MNTSVRWLNEYLTPSDVSAASAGDVLTNTGFPIEETVELDNGDVMLDVEVTSNRGDCLSHIGLAREIASATHRSLRMPTVPDRIEAGPGEGADGAIAIDNRIPELCSLFTGRVIKGVSVGPSPDWLVRALEAVGLRSVNNVVDVTNYVLMEFGQPTHVFDLATLGAGPSGRPTLIVRNATKGETLPLLDGTKASLVDGDMVIADGADRPVSLAGIMGGSETEVGSGTTDVLLEAATWDPVTVRTTSRRLRVRSDSSHRYERIVDPRTIDLAARRAADLIVQLAGGELLPGAVEVGVPARPPTVVSLRPDRCRALLGVDVSDTEASDILNALEIQTVASDGVLTCTVPAIRPDLTREIDLIEEVIRIHGISKLPVHDKMSVPVPAPQASERGSAELASLLNGLGFYEAITFTFVSRDVAKRFCPRELGLLDVSDDRRGAEPVLRPSIIPSLLQSRRSNQAGQVRAAGGIRLYEIAPVFGATADGVEVERRVLSMIADAPESGKAQERRQHAIRLMRGVVDTLASRLHGGTVAFEPADVPIDAYEPGACGAVTINGERVGVVGLLSKATRGAYDLKHEVVACELSMDALLGSFPPASKAERLPEFPGIERDVSLVVNESVGWAQVEGLIGSSSLALLDGHDFVGTFRGGPIDTGKKSLTLRLKFRDPARTLRHEEVDPQVATFVERATSELGAEIRQ